MGLERRTPTLSDVAAAAGVSYATADRVVNGRGSASARAVAKVEEAVAALGYVRNVAAANLSRKRTYRFVFVLPEGPNAFFAHMRAIIADHAVRLRGARVDVRVQSVPAFDAAALAATLTAIAQDPVDGVAVVGLVGSHGVDAALAQLTEAQVPVVSLVSDLPPTGRAAYIGIDNAMAGRTAARLVGLAHGGQAGRVQVIMGSTGAQDHRDRFAGFRAVLSRDFPRLTLLDPIEGRDNAATVATEVAQVLRTTPGLSAIYNLGAGNSGLPAALDAAPQGRPFCVAHELVPATRAALARGQFDAVIDQRPDEEVAAALALLRAFSDRVPPPPQTPILPTIYLRDNLPPEPPEHADRKV